MFTIHNNQAFKIVIQPNDGHPFMTIEQESSQKKIMSVTKIVTITYRDIYLCLHILYIIYILYIYTMFFLKFLTTNTWPVSLHRRLVRGRPAGAHCLGPLQSGGRFRRRFHGMLRRNLHRWRLHLRNYGPKYQLYPWNWSTDANGHNCISQWVQKNILVAYQNMIRNILVGKIWSTIPFIILVEGIPRLPW